MLKNAIRLFAFALLVTLLSTIPACTSRSITVTSTPPGAEVTINHRLVGVTPCRVGFTHYGVYSIELRKEKFEPLSREETINTPGYGYDPISFVTDNAIPARLNDDIYLHYVMKPEGELSERNALLQRMELARLGQIHLKDGREVAVPYSTPPKTPEQLAKDAQKTQDAANPPTTPGKDGQPPPVIPKPDFKIKEIPTEAPKPPNIGKDLNIKPPEKKPETPKPDEPAKDPQKDTPPTPRTPKSEELIFEKPAADAPKTDEKK